MNENQTEQEVISDVPVKRESIEVTNIAHFLFLLKEWHDHKLHIVSHMMEVPDGTEITVVDDKEGTEHTLSLTGDARFAFIAGLSVALSEFGDLPFHMERTPNESEIH